jgi:hypothetical protein
MSQMIPNQHPAVVLRAQYNHVRALLAVAMIAVIGLTVALVLVAADNGSGTSGAAVISPAATLPGQTGTTRYDGGREEGTSGASATAPRSPSTRYDGGPEEGTSGR